MAADGWQLTSLCRKTLLKSAAVLKLLSLICLQKEVRFLIILVQLLLLIHDMQYVRSKQPTSRSLQQQICKLPIDLDGYKLRELKILMVEKSQVGGQVLSVVVRSMRLGQVVKWRLVGRVKKVRQARKSRDTETKREIKY